MLAEVVQVGTRFACSVKRSHKHDQNYKNTILKARCTDTTISAQRFGHAVRSQKSNLIENLITEKDAFTKKPDLTVFKLKWSLSKVVVQDAETWFGHVMT